MTKLRRKGFTLIELIAVLVIMAILALIVTPLVMNIVRKARIAADKRSIDAYGRSIELAIASYLLDNGKFPTSVGDLSIEYSGDTVSCTTEQINPDSSIYLAGCTVAGRTVDYAYGKYEAPSYTAYSVGDHISYNGVTYYVIEDSDTTKDTVKLLKDTPLTKSEIEGYNIAGLSVNGDSTGGVVEYGSSTDYETSTVKKVVDAWKTTAVKEGDSASARLITFDELNPGLGITESVCTYICFYIPTNLTPDWLKEGWTWTMTEKDSSKIWSLDGRSALGYKSFSASSGVRPVLEISKSADLTKLES